MAGKYGIGARVRDEDGDEGVIVGKRKGERLVEYVELGDARIWVRKSRLTAIDEPPATAEQQQGDEPKFKVGDRVRLLTDEGEGRPAGSVGTVYKADRPGCDLDVIFDGWTNGHNGDAKDGSSNHWYLFNQDVELLTEWQPKVGDRVRFADDVVSGTGTIVADGPDSFDWTVRPDKGGDYFYRDDRFSFKTRHFDRRHLEPLPVAAEAHGAGNLEDDVTAIFDELEAWLGEDIPVAVPPVAVAPATATPAAPARTFKVGDRVRVKCGDLTGTIASRNSAGAMAIRHDGSDHVGFQFWHDDELEPADTPVSAGAPATPAITKGSLVTLAQPALVTGIARHHAHLLLATGGAYTLPVAALVAA